MAESLDQITHPLRRSWPSHPGDKIPARLVEKSDVSSTDVMGLPQRHKHSSATSHTATQGQRCLKIQRNNSQELHLGEGQRLSHAKLSLNQGWGSQVVRPSHWHDLVIQLGQCRENGIWGWGEETAKTVGHREVMKLGQTTKQRASLPAYTRERAGHLFCLSNILTRLHLWSDTKSGFLCTAPHANPRLGSKPMLLRWPWHKG